MSSKTARVAISLGVGFVGGSLCFVLYYVVGVAWEIHRFPGTNMASLAEFITGVPVGLVSGLAISVATWRRIGPQGPQSIVARGLLAALLGVLAALLGFFIVNAAYISHYYGKSGSEHDPPVAIVVGILSGLAVFWRAWKGLKRA